MKKIQILLLSVCPAVFGQSTIDLSKPVSQSLKPDVVYWSFDQGLPGQSLPEVVEDESGNGLDGRLLAVMLQVFPMPLLAMVQLELPPHLTTRV